MDSFTNGLLANSCNPHVDPCGALWPVVCRHKLQSPGVDLPDSDGTRPSSAFLVLLPACSCPFCSQLSATFFRFLSFVLTSLCEAAPKRSAVWSSQGRPGCAFRRECSVRFVQARGIVLLACGRLVSQQCVFNKVTLNRNAHKTRPGTDGLTEAL